jgi:hypothetical protein
LPKRQLYLGLGEDCLERYVDYLEASGEAVECELAKVVFGDA